jgi:hypothetical protein
MTHERLYIRNPIAGGHAGWGSDGNYHVEAFGAKYTVPRESIVSTLTQAGVKDFSYIDWEIQAARDEEARRAQ